MIKNLSRLPPHIQTEKKDGDEGRDKKDRKEGKDKRERRVESGERDMQSLNLFEMDLGGVDELNENDKRESMVSFFFSFCFLFSVFYFLFSVFCFLFLMNFEI
jgi:hypothetical protein